MAAKRILDEAKETVDSRRAVYGSPESNLGCIAKLWSAWLTTRFGVPIELTIADHCSLMRLIKESRLAQTPSHRDSLLDIAGYVDCEDEVSGEPRGVDLDLTATCRKCGKKLRHPYGLCKDGAIHEAAQ